MATIDELMEGKKPGEIRIIGDNMPKGMWFQPYYKQGQYWHGPAMGCEHAFWRNDDDNFSLYTKPKKKVKKVKRWLWVGLHPQYEWMAPNEYRSDEEMEKEKKATVMTKLRKLPWSEMEFDE